MKLQNYSPVVANNNTDHCWTHLRGALNGACQQIHSGEIGHFAACQQRWDPPQHSVSVEGVYLFSA